MKENRKKRPKIEVCATPAGPCVSAEDEGLHPVVLALGGLAVVVGIVKLIKALEG